MIKGFYKRFQEPKDLSSSDKVLKKEQLWKTLKSVLRVSDDDNKIFHQVYYICFMLLADEFGYFNQAVIQAAPTLNTAAGGGNYADVTSWKHWISRDGAAVKALLPLTS